jgi:hypothetical protein
LIAQPLQAGAEQQGVVTPRLQVSLHTSHCTRLLSESRATLARSSPSSTASSEVAAASQLQQRREAVSRLTLQLRQDWAPQQPRRTPRRQTASQTLQATEAGTFAPPAGMAAAAAGRSYFLDQIIDLILDNFAETSINDEILAGNFYSFNSGINEPIQSNLFQLITENIYYRV